MKLPPLNLDDPAAVAFDNSGKTAAFFCKISPLLVDNRVVRQLKDYSRAHGGANIRLCLHSGPKASFHQMIILERRGRYCPPHKHPKKPESLHHISGDFGVFVFNENGRLLGAERLRAGGNFIFRVEADCFHMVMPLSGIAIYHECKPGPFLGKSDTMFAPWAPDGNDAVAMRHFLDDLRRALPRA